MNNPTIRVRAGALLLRDDDKVLLIEYDEPGVDAQYAFPGGGVDPGEGLHEALRRELREEACAEIEIQRLLCVYEYLPRPNGSFGRQQHVSFLFLCTLQPGCEPRLPDTPDPYQIGVRWVNLHQLDTVPLLPPGMKSQIIAALDMPGHFDPFSQHE